MDADKHVSNLNPTPLGKGCSLHSSQTMSDVFKVLNIFSVSEVHGQSIAFGRCREEKQVV